MIQQTKQELRDRVAVLETEVQFLRDDAAIASNAYLLNRNAQLETEIKHKEGLLRAAMRMAFPKSDVKLWSDAEIVTVIETENDIIRYRKLRKIIMKNLHPDTHASMRPSEKAILKRV